MQGHPRTHNAASQSPHQAAPTTHPSNLAKCAPTTADPLSDRSPGSPQSLKLLESDAEDEHKEALGGVDRGGEGDAPRQEVCSVWGNETIAVRTQKGVVSTCITTSPASLCSAQAERPLGEAQHDHCALVHASGATMSHTASSTSRSPSGYPARSLQPATPPYDPAGEAVVAPPVTEAVTDGDGGGNDQMREQTTAASSLSHGFSPPLASPTLQQLVARAIDNTAVNTTAGPTKREGRATVQPNDGKTILPSSPASSTLGSGERAIPPKHWTKVGVRRSLPAAAAEGEGANTSSTPPNRSPAASMGAPPAQQERLQSTVCSASSPSPIPTTAGEAAAPHSSSYVSRSPSGRQDSSSSSSPSSQQKKHKNQFPSENAELLGNPKAETVAECLPATLQLIDLWNRFKKNGGPLDFHLIMRYLAHGADICYRREGLLWRPLLHEFIDAGQWDCALLCIRQSAQPLDLRARDVIFQQNAMHWACEKHVLDADTATFMEAVVHRLETHPEDTVDWWQQNENRHNVLALAAAHQKLSVVWPLLKGVPQFADRVDPIALPLVWAWDWEALGPTEQVYFHVEGVSTVVPNGTVWEKLGGIADDDVDHGKEAFDTTGSDPASGEEWEMEVLREDLRAAATSLPRRFASADEYSPTTKAPPTSMTARSCSPSFTIPDRIEEELGMALRRSHAGMSVPDRPSPLDGAVGSTITHNKNSASRNATSSSVVMTPPSRARHGPHSARTTTSALRGLPLTTSASPSLTVPWVSAATTAAVDPRSQHLEPHHHPQRRSPSHGTTRTSDRDSLTPLWRDRLSQRSVSPPSAPYTANRTLVPADAVTGALCKLSWLAAPNPAHVRALVCGGDDEVQPRRNAALTQEESMMTWGTRGTLTSIRSSSPSRPPRSLSGKQTREATRVQRNDMESQPSPSSFPTITPEESIVATLGWVAPSAPQHPPYRRVGTVGSNPQGSFVEKWKIHPPKRASTHSSAVPLLIHDGNATGAGGSTSASPTPCGEHGLQRHRAETQHFPTTSGRSDGPVDAKTEWKRGDSRQRGTERAGHRMRANVLFFDPLSDHHILLTFLENGDAPCVRACLETPSPLDFTLRGGCGQTIFTYAFKPGRTPGFVEEVLEALLDRLAAHPEDVMDWSITDERGRDCLSLAAFWQQLSVVFPILMRRRVPYFQVPLTSCCRLSPGQHTFQLSWDISSEDLAQLKPEYQARFTTGLPSSHGTGGGGVSQQPRR